MSLRRIWIRLQLTRIQLTRGSLYVLAFVLPFLVGTCASYCYFFTNG